MRYVGIVSVLVVLCGSVLKYFQGTYDSNYEAIEPDPYIIDLNTELVQCDEFMTIHLPMKERKYGEPNSTSYL